MKKTIIFFVLTFILSSCTIQAQEIPDSWKNLWGLLPNKAQQKLDAHKKELETFQDELNDDLIETQNELSDLLANFRTLVHAEYKTEYINLIHESVGTFEHDEGKGSYSIPEEQDGDDWIIYAVEEYIDSKVGYSYAFNITEFFPPDFKYESSSKLMDIDGRLNVRQRQGELDIGLPNVLGELSRLRADLNGKIENHLNKIQTSHAYVHYKWKVSGSYIPFGKGAKLRAGLKLTYKRLNKASFENRVNVLNGQIDLLNAKIKQIDQKLEEINSLIPK